MVILGHLFRIMVSTTLGLYITKLEIFVFEIVMKLLYLNICINLLFHTSVAFGIHPEQYTLNYCQTLGESLATGDRCCMEDGVIVFSLSISTWQGYACKDEFLVFYGRPEGRKYQSLYKFTVKRMCQVFFLMSADVLSWIHSITNYSGDDFMQPLESPISPSDWYMGPLSKTGAT